MSAPMTPTEMAEWLDKVYGYIKRKHSTTEDEAIRDRVVAWLRAQPTDAQKVEALNLASDAGAVGEAVWKSMHVRDPNSYVPASLATVAGRDARTALRLLGLPTE